MLGTNNKIKLLYKESTTDSYKKRFSKFKNCIDDICNLGNNIGTPMEQFVDKIKESIRAELEKEYQTKLEKRIIEIRLKLEREYEQRMESEQDMWNLLSTQFDNIESNISTTPSNVNISIKNTISPFEDAGKDNQEKQSFEKIDKEQCNNEDSVYDIEVDSSVANFDDISLQSDELLSCYEECQDDEYSKSYFEMLQTLSKGDLDNICLKLGYSRVGSVQEGDITCDKSVMIHENEIFPLFPPPILNTASTQTYNKIENTATQALVETDAKNIQTSNNSENRVQEILLQFEEKFEKRKNELVNHNLVLEQRLKVANETIELFKEKHESEIDKMIEHYREKIEKLKKSPIIGSPEAPEVQTYLKKIHHRYNIEIKQLEELIYQDMAYEPSHLPSSINSQKDVFELNISRLCLLRGQLCLMIGDLKVLQQNRAAPICQPKILTPKCSSALPELDENIPVEKLRSLLEDEIQIRKSLQEEKNNLQLRFQRMEKTLLLKRKNEPICIPSAVSKDKCQN